MCWGAGGCSIPNASQSFQKPIGQAPVTQYRPPSLHTDHRRSIPAIVTQYRPPSLNTDHRHSIQTTVTEHMGFCLSYNNSRMELISQDLSKKRQQQNIRCILNTVVTLVIKTSVGLFRDGNSVICSPFNAPKNGKQHECGCTGS